MSDALHTFHVNLEALADEVRATHRSNFSRRMREYAQRSSFPGLRSVANFRSKYAGCEYVRIGGGTARKLTAREIAEFRAAIDLALESKA